MNFITVHKECKINKKSNPQQVAEWSHLRDHSTLRGRLAQDDISVESAPRNSLQPEEHPA